MTSSRFFSYEKTYNFYKKLEKSIERYPYYFYCRSASLFSNYIRSNLETLNFEKLKNNHYKLFLFHLFFLIISIITLIKVKLKKIKKAHYLIDINNSKDNYDFRSKYILNDINPKETINFLHVSNFRYSFKSFYKKTNPFYFESIFYFLKFFIKEERYEIKVNYNLFNSKEERFVKQVLENYNEEVKQSYKKIQVYSKILHFLNLEKFYFIDDSRHTNELIIASNKNNIETIGYMHARFNNYFVGLNYYPFDKYLVFSNYFKNLIIKMNKNYKKENIIIIGHPNVKSVIQNLREKIKKQNDKINVLILGEIETNYENEIKFYETLQNQKNINLFYRGKPGFEIKPLKDFLDKNPNIKYINDGTFLESLVKNKIDVVLGIYSTALIESWLVNVPSIMIKSYVDLSKHFIEDNLVYYCDKKEDLIKLINKVSKLNNKELEKKRKEVWD